MNSLQDLIHGTGHTYTNEKQTSRANEPRKHPKTINYELDSLEEK